MGRSAVLVGTVPGPSDRAMGHACLRPDHTRDTHDSAGAADPPPLNWSILKLWNEEGRRWRGSVTSRRRLSACCGRQRFCTVRVCRWWMRSGSWGSATNLSRHAERVIAFYNQRGAAEVAVPKRPVRRHPAPHRPTQIAASPSMTEGKPLFNAADRISASRSWTRRPFPAVAALHWRSLDLVGSQLPAGRRLACASNRSEPHSNGLGELHVGNPG